MRNLEIGEFKLIAGSALKFDNGQVYNVPKDGMPKSIYKEIDSNLQNVIDGVCSQEKFFAIMQEKNCMPYLETYFENLWDLFY